MSTTTAECIRLEQRLHDGWQRITDAQRAGLDTEAWEDFWCRLLAEYEATFADTDDISLPERAEDRHAS